MPVCLISLGSNLGDRQQTLDRAIELLARQPAVRLVAQSGWQQTRPVGGPAGQGPFLNGAAVLETSLGPEALLAVLEQVESRLGRQRTERWGPRQLDLDLLLYGQLVLQTDRLSLPHPRMAWRRFVLEPAAQVAPAMVHPTTGWTIARLLDHLNTAIPYVAIAGPIAAGKTRLAGQLAQSRPACWIAEQLSLQRLAAFYAHPSGTAWAVELEFLNERARLLRADLPQWSQPGRLWVSDFWFPQGLAYASVWLSPAQLEAYAKRWEAARRKVIQPKLTVLLDAPADRLQERISRRGRPGEQHLSRQLLERIRQAIRQQADRPGQGPLLRLADEDPGRILAEVTAALEAMQ